MVPAAAAQEHGAHLRLAARCDAEALLFPAGIQGLHAWRDALPPIPKWRALPAQELYAEPPLWPDVIDAWITPQTWVLLIDDETDGRTVRPAWTTPRLATALPQQRALRVALTALGHPRQATEPNRGLQQKWPAALHHLALWHSEPAKAPAAAFTAWLRERVHPAASRRIVVLHGRGDAALAEMLASRLDGRTDAKGRFVEAWTSSAEGRFDWGMPLSGLRFMMQVVMHHAMPDESADAQQRLARRIQRFIVHAVFRIPQTQPAAFEVVSLLSGSLRAAVEDWTGGWQSGPVLTAATRRIGVQVDAGAGPIHPLDGQLALPGTHDAEVTALARQLLDEAWVGVAPAARALPGTHDAEVNALARQLLDEAWVGVVPAARAAAGVEAVSTLALPAAVTAMASLGGDGLAAALATGQVMLVSHRGTPTTLPGMPNATCLLALGEGELGMANADGLVGRWRAGTASMQVLGQHRGAVRALAHSDAGWLLSGGDDRILRGWGLAVGDRRETGGFPAAITAIDVEAGRVFIACGEAGVFVMTSVSDTPSQALQVRDASVDVLQVHGDNLYVAGRNATGTGFASRAMLRHEGLPARDLALPAPVSAFVVLADERVALGCEDGSLWMWTPGSEGANRLDELPRQQGAVRALVVDAHGILCSAGIDGIVRRQPR
jgi:hypothetical protein